MEEYVKELDIVLQQIQSLKIEGTYGNVLIMKECIERLINLGRKMGGQGQPPAPVLQMVPPQTQSVHEQSEPEIVEVEEIENEKVENQ